MHIPAELFLHHTVTQNVTDMHVPIGISLAARRCTRFRAKLMGDREKAWQDMEDAEKLVV